MLCIKGYAPKSVTEKAARSQLEKQGSLRKWVGDSSERTRVLLYPRSHGFEVLCVQWGTSDMTVKGHKLCADFNEALFRFNACLCHWTGGLEMPYKPQADTGNFCASCP